MLVYWPWHCSYWPWHCSYWPWHRTFSWPGRLWSPSTSTETTTGWRQKRHSQTLEPTLLWCHPWLQHVSSRCNAGCLLILVSLNAGCGGWVLNAVWFCLAHKLTVALTNRKKWTNAAESLNRWTFLEQVRAWTQTISLRAGMFDILSCMRGGAPDNALNSRPGPFERRI